MSLRLGHPNLIQKIVLYRYLGTLLGAKAFLYRTTTDLSIQPLENIHIMRHQHLPTETSPLLDHPPVSQIEDNSDYKAYAENTSTVNMFWEELAVLTKYAIPVFGYVPSFF